MLVVKALRTVAEKELFSLGVLKKKELSDVSIAVEAETEAATENKEAVR